MKREDPTTIKHIDLFSGIGGFALAARWAGFETVLFCEQNNFCKQVLKKHWPEVPIVNDIQNLRKEVLPDEVFGETTKLILTGGFP
jgi:DNA (cytosine-5)-methyltransferase 1